jgi:hypothetical protein
MKLKDFKKIMKKNIFKTEEAHVIAFKNNPKLINLELHQWYKQGELIKLKRGLYMFADSKVNIAEIADSLYSPCYFSLEYILSFSSIIPEAVFNYTLVTIKATRTFKTPFGVFLYRKIKKKAFTGFDEKTLFAMDEKALVDYFYLNASNIEGTNKFFEDARLNVENLNFNKIFKFAFLYKCKKLNFLLNKLQNYAKSYQNY